MKKYTGINLKSMSLILSISLILAVAFHPATPSAEQYTTDPTSYVLNKFQSHDVVFLGTSHQQPRLLSFLSDLMPHLHKAGVTHICLEIHSDQQTKLDHYIQSGQGLSKIELWPQIECPEYRSFLKTIRGLPPNNAISPVAIDLPRSRFKENISRDEYMAQRISELYDTPESKNILVVLGNLHVLKKLDWEDHVPNKHPSAYEYLSKNHPEIKKSSIAQLVGNQPKPCDFTKQFSHIEGMVALDCTDRFSDWKIGLLSIIAIKETLPHEAFDGLIVY